MSATTTARLAISNLSITSLRRRRVHLSPAANTNPFDKFQNKSNGPVDSGPKSLVQGTPARAKRSRNNTTSNGVVVSNGSSLLQNGAGSAATITHGSTGSGLKLNTLNTRGHFAATASTPSTSTPVTTTTNLTYDEPKAGEFESDLIVVLDMDECLIHSQFLKLSAFDDYRQYEADRPPSQAFTHDDHEPTTIIPSACESFKMSIPPDGDLVHVNKRPNLDYFLRRITERYETYVFTAAMEVYASPLLDALDPKGTMFQKRFYRQHCTYDESLGVYIKDLENAFVSECNDSDNDSVVSNGALSSPLCNTEYPLPSSLPSFNDKRIVLVDNNPYSFLANPSNGILVSNFYDDPKDDTLHAVMELLDELDDVEDVRPILDSKFGLKDALKEVSRTNHWR